jgi:hypothetical protein
MFVKCLVMLDQASQRKLDRLVRLSPEDFNRFLAFVAVREYLFDHPFSRVEIDGERIFNDDYRLFVLSMTLPGELCENMPLDELSQVTGVDEDVLHDWMRRS